jgi:hypothetical protein
VLQTFWDQEPFSRHGGIRKGGALSRKMSAELTICHKTAIKLIDKQDAIMLGKDGRDSNTDERVTPMKSFRLPLFSQLFFTLVLALLFASGTAHARPAVPFTATIAITESILPPGASPCTAIGSISGTGQATHLGKVTVISQDCITLIPPSFSFASDQLLLTAANGDQVFAAYSGFLTSEGTVGVITGGYQIVGGTGRFSQATGAGSVHGVEDLITGKGQVQLNGTISY